MFIGDLLEQAGMLIEEKAYIAFHPGIWPETAKNTSVEKKDEPEKEEYKEEIFVDEINQTGSECIILNEKVAVLNQMYENLSTDEKEELCNEIQQLEQLLHFMKNHIRGELLPEDVSAIEEGMLKLRNSMEEFRQKISNVC